jgi:hypothetical protein
MSRPKLLFLSVFLILALSANAQNPSVDCDKIEVTIETKSPTTGKSDGSVKVNFIKGDRKSVKFIFCDRKGKVLNEKEFKKQELLGLEKGNYFLIVSTDDCSKKIDFNIE